MRTLLHKHCLTSLLLTILACGSALADKPITINLPAGHVFQAADFADELKNGNFLGLGGLRGRALKPIDGKYAVYIVGTPEEWAEGYPLQAGDVVLALQDHALPESAVFQFKQVLGVGRKRASTVKLARWRRGKIETVEITFDTPKPPDLTKGGIHDPEQISWTLGATGAHGWTWSIPHKTAAWYLSNQKPRRTWERTPQVLQVLVEQYAGHAKAVLPELEKAAEYYEPDGLAGAIPGCGSQNAAKLIRAAIEQIKTAPTPDWELTSIAEYLK